MRGTSLFVDRCQGHFDSRSRERGALYDRRQRVRLLRDDLAGVTASVRGSEDYRLSVSLASARGAKTTLAVFCSCPRFADGVYCKHLFALFRHLDRAGSVFEAPDLGPIRLRRSAGERFEIDERADGSVDDPNEPAYRRRAARPAPRAALRKPLAPALPGWLIAAQELRERALPHGLPGELLYVVSLAGFHSDLWVQMMRRIRLKSGDWSRPLPTSVPHAAIAQLAEPDRAALLALGGCRSLGYSSYAEEQAVGRRAIPEGLRDLILPLLARTGRLCELEGSELRFLQVEPEPVSAHMQIERANAAGMLRVSLALRGAGVSDPQELRALNRSGLALAGDRILRLADPEAAALVESFRESGPTQVPAKRGAALIEGVASAGGLAIEGLAELGWTEEHGTPEPTLRVRKPEGAHAYAIPLLAVEIRFHYGATLVDRRDPRAVLVDAVEQRIVRRDLGREEDLTRDAFAAGCSPLSPSMRYRDDADAQLAPRALAGVAAALIARGWRVEADGIPLRQASGRKFSVRSGVDWFDLNARVEFGDESVGLPVLLAAVARGERTVLLGDGSHGLLPDEWLARVAPLAELGEASADGVRFRTQQALLLDALLASEPEVDADAAFRNACSRLERAGEPRPRNAAREFAGALREYQCEGLGWLHYLGEARIGACLADDMGLGKTVQVLALLAELHGAVSGAQRASAARGEAKCEKPTGVRRRGRDARSEPQVREAQCGDERLPSLVVAPSSVVPNWLAEAARFAPSLRVLDFTGTQRGEKREQIGANDLVVTSYGTLRSEIEKLAQQRFAAVVLDEAQAIKNAGSKTAKAARLLRAERRIALSGTPVENHLGELWSLFDFLNPGLLGKSARSLHVLDDLGDAGVAALAKAVRPFILRRTKQQVLRELPAKTAQTLVCELPGAQRRLYDELLRHYRASVLSDVEKRGLARSKLHVLEALLRLRQAACHPGLIDSRRATGGSAKLDLLMEQLDATLAEGHKALVFSQFTSLLALVRERLDAKGVVYEYLDGRTRDRAPRVARFQEDAACPLFLISLKAGGLGLNLTAADTVYLLDPWWNPAVEAQAIDRAHRIGQTKPVNAYRLVAKNTIEEKILALQERKRALADAVISADASVLRTLTREDLEVLLG